MVTESRQSNIAYANWNSALKECDTPPFLAQEYHSWMQNTPSEVSSLLINLFMVRQIVSYGLLQKPQRQQWIADHLSPQEYPAHRDILLATGKKIEVIFNDDPYIEQKYKTNLQAIIINGSSLLQPMRGHDIDYWMLFLDPFKADDFNNYIAKPFEKRIQQILENDKISINSSALFGLSQRYIYVPPLAFPHLVVLTCHGGRERYDEAARQAIEYVQGRKKFVTDFIISQVSQIKE